MRIIADSYGNIIKPKDGPNIADLCAMYCLSKGGDYDRLPHRRAPDPVLAGHRALMRRSHDDHVTPPLIHEPHHRLTTRPRHAITSTNCNISASARFNFGRKTLHDIV